MRIHEIMRRAADGRDGHKLRKLAIIGGAAAVITISGASAAWALTADDAGATPEATGATTAPRTDAASPTADEAEELARASELLEAERLEAERQAEAEAAAEAEAEAEAKAAEEAAKPPVVAPVGGLDAEQMANAVLIIETGDELGFGERGWAVAIATAMQEAKLYNAASNAVPESWNYTDSSVHYEDHDSVGIFQQRHSMGWGSIEELMDVETSASKFYNTLKQVSGWEGMSVTGAAQAVQRSAHPDLYAQWESLAWEVIEAYKAAR